MLHRQKNNYINYAYNIHTRKEIIQYLITAGANVNSTLTDKPPLYYARNNVVITLIEAGADKNWCDNYKCSLIHHSSNRRRLQTLEAYIQAGANVNTKNNDGYTPLMMACKSNHIDIVKTLVKANANLTSVNHDGDTALCIPQNNKFEDLTKYLKCEINWHKCRPLLLIRAHADHKTNKEHKLSGLGPLVIANRYSGGETCDLKRLVVSFL